MNLNHNLQFMIFNHFKDKQEYISLKVVKLMTKLGFSFKKYAKYFPVKCENIITDNDLRYLKEESTDN